MSIKEKQENTQVGKNGKQEAGKRISLNNRGKTLTWTEKRKKNLLVR